MSSTDNRVVKMEFDNDTFKKKAAETKQSLSDLNKAVDSTGKSKGLLDLDSNMQRVSVSASKMAIVTTTALATITNKVVNAGLAMAKSLTFDPIKQGFHEYESLLTKQNVIMNATGKSATFVKGILNELNRYSDKTIYSFGNMTDAVQKFVNAGVPLKQSVTSIKGIANAAAFAGASSEEANRAMYAFSQSMSLGFIQLQDWNQIENANMGTIQFKKQLLEAAVAVGTLTKRGKEYVTQNGKTISATKGWRDGLKEQWATTQVLNKALGKYADENTKLGKKAFKSAQDVRTFSAFLDTLKESLGSGWAQIFTALIGGLKQSTKMWTGLSNAIGSVVQGFFNWASTALTVWRSMGGFKKVLEGFHNLLSPIGAILGVIGKAWRAAFPNSSSGTGKALYGLSAAFAAITSPLQLLANLIGKLANPLKFFFQLVKIGATGIKEVVGYITDFVSGVAGAIDLKAPSSGGFLGWLKDVASAIGGTIDQVSKLLDKGKSLKDAFSSIKMPKLPSLPSLPDFGNIGGGGPGGSGGIGARLASLVAPLKGMDIDFNKIGKGFQDVGKSAQTGGGKVASAGKTMGDAIANVWNWFKKFMGDFNFDDLMASFNLAVLTTFMFSITRFFNAMSKSFEGFAGIGGSATNVLDQAGNALKSFQTQARAKLILNIAIALGILAAALWVLSKIPIKQLAPALLALGITFKILNKSMEKMTELVKAMDGAKISVNLIAISIAITALAGAMILLSIAMLIMNKVKWDSILKGLIVMRVLLVSMQQLGTLAKTAGKNMIAAAAAIALIAGSMIVLATALLMFKLVDWESMGKAGVALAGVALAVGLLALIPYEGIAKVGLALALASTGMVAMAMALILFKAVKWESIGKLAVVLVALGVALAAITALGGPATASGLVALSAAMIGLAMAGLILNKVNWSSLGKMGVILLGLVVAVAAFAAILAAFLYIIAPVSPVLMGLAGAFALLGLGLLAFSAAMAIAMTLAGAGTAAFAALATGAAVAIAVFLQTLASEAPIMKDSMLKILQAMIDGIVEAVPMIIDGIKRLWAAIKKELGGDDKKKGAGDSGKSWMTSIMDGIKEKIPELVEKAKDLAIRFIKGLISKGAEIGAAAAILIARFVQGIASKIGDVAQAAANLIIRFVAAIGKQAVRIAKAAYDTVITFINKLADTIRENGPRMGDAMSNLGIAMVQGLIGGIGAMFENAMSAIGGLAEGMVGKAKSILKIFSPSRVFRDIGQFLVQGLTNGIQNNAASAITAVASMVSGQIAVASGYVNEFIQRLDQQAIAARAKADGLAAAADRAAKAAKMTKGKKDDKAAKNLSNQAEAASKVADAAEAQAEARKAAQDRAEQFASASTLEKAKMRSEDAQNQLDAAKAAEARAAKNLAAANALDRQSKAAGVSAKERKQLRKQADDLRAQARADANAANTQLAAARASAADALAYQKQAGDEAAAAFQAAFEADAKAAADQEAFNKLSDADKAAYRRKQAEDLQAKAAKDLTDAKKLAYTDLEAANKLAEQAMNEADQARQYFNEATQLESSAAQGVGGVSGGGVMGTVVNLDPTDAAAVVMNDYSKLYDAATAAAAATPTMEFNQYNTSPEPLSPIEVYRQTHNLLNTASEKIADAVQAA